MAQTQDTARAPLRVNRSALFRAYNAARTLGVDRGRLNRALGLAQRKAYESEYRTTTKACDCADAYYRHTTCKHQLAAALRALAKE